MLRDPQVFIDLLASVAKEILELDAWLASSSTGQPDSVYMAVYARSKERKDFYSTVAAVADSCMESD